MALAEPAGVEEQPPEPGSARWWAARAERLDRRRPRADGFTVEQIVEAALQLVDEESLEALTVRRLAGELGTGSATLYRHVASRDELLVLLVDRVIGDVRYPDDALDGRARVVGLASELRRVLMGHPHLVPALRAAPLLGPNARKGSARAVAALLDAGFPAEVAVPAYLALIDYVLGTVFFDTGRSATWSVEVEAELRRPEARLPRSLAGRLGPVEVPSDDAVFAFGLQVFLDGLEAAGLAGD